MRGKRQIRGQRSIWRDFRPLPERMTQDEQICSLVLTRIPGLGLTGAFRLVSSLGSATRVFEHRKELSQLVPGAVSYTHLDVYKRQGSPCFAVAVSPFHNLHHSITFRIISFIMILLFFFSCCFHKDSTLKSLCQGISGVSGWKVTKRKHPYVKGFSSGQVRVLFLTSTVFHLSDEVSSPK